MLIFFLIKESFLFAWNSLVNNKLRTFLSLLGITIGIFAIISVFTIIDSMENSIRQNIARLGDNVVYVQKWPWSMGGDYPWWKYLNRPVPQIEELDEILRRSQLTQAACFMAATQKNVSFEKRTIEAVQISAVTQSYEDLVSFEIQNGRYLSPFESKAGKNQAVIGADIAIKLFPDVNPVGKTIKVGGYKLNVIGVFAKQGENMFGLSTDQTVVLPVLFARNLMRINHQSTDPLIMVKARDGISADELIDELTGIMRAIRRLGPNEEINFALNQTSLISKGFDGIFQILDLTGLVIGGFSILVGGFGIANIMFVSVKEQTRIIGIQKAIGSKRNFILGQFLFEAITLALFGGILGLVLIFFLSLLVSATGMDMTLSFSNIVLGLGISISIGLVAGIVPAYMAAKLDPVEAMSSI